MEQLVELLKRVKADVDFVNEKSLVDDGILDSLEIVTIITSIEETYGFEIDPNEIDPDNFQSAESMWNMIQRLKK